MGILQHESQVGSACAFQLFYKLRGNRDAEHVRHLFGIIAAHALPRHLLAGLGRFTLLGFHRLALFAVQGALRPGRGHRCM